eukprot:577403-Alexandrium_andersonii.AAC.1
MKEILRCVMSSALISESWRASETFGTISSCSTPARTLAISSLSGSTDSEMAVRVSARMLTR